MRNPFYWFIILAVTVGLSACSVRTEITPTTAPALPVSPLDGEWSGSGSTAGGIPFHISFTVQGGRLAGILYSFEGSDGLTCSGIEFAQIPVGQRPIVEASRLSATLAEDFGVTADFQDQDNSRGELVIHWMERQPRCNGDYIVHWTAAKQSSIAAPIKPEDAAPSHSLLATLIQILVFGLSNGSVLALNAMGVTIIYSAVRTINLAHGDVFALTTALVTSIINAAGIHQGWHPAALAAALLLVMLAAIGLAALLSMGVDQFGFRPFRGASRLAPMIATLGLSFILFQGALVWRTFQGSWIPGEHRSVPGIPEVPTDGIPTLLPEVNLAAHLGIPGLVIRSSDVLVLVVALIFAGLVTLFLRRTRTGRAIQALAQNPSMARMVGVDVDGTIRRAFAVGGAFAGAAAFIFALYYSRPFGAHGAQSGLMAFMAALMGGIGSPVGALLSGWLIGVFSSFSDYFIQAQWTPVLLLTILMGVLVWRPAGLTADLKDPGTGAPVRDTAILPSPDAARSKRNLLVLLAGLAVFPLLAELFGWGGEAVLRTVGVFSLLALGLNLALGAEGLLDFGYAAGFGLGGFAGALLSQYDGSLGLVAGAAVGGLLGLLKGGLAARLRGDFLVVATLALGLLIRQTAVNLTGITGGAGGMGGFPSLQILGWRITSPDLKYYLVIAFVALAAALSRRLLGSKMGRALKASSEDESAAEAAGVNVNRTRLMALVVSSGLAGLAGALYAGTFSYVDPELMSFHVSSMVLAMVILGGAGSIPGAILGAAAIILYDKVFVPRLADLAALIWPEGLAIGSAPDIRGASFFNFGIALYLTILFRARRRKDA